MTNRQDGFAISASILARSKFYGNSTSAILEGTAVLTLLPRGEDYKLTVPYAHCKGILMGTLTMELGGKVTIDCEKTGYYTEIEFKLKVKYMSMLYKKIMFFFLILAIFGWFRTNELYLRTFKIRKRNTSHSRGILGRYHSN